jgi:DNA-binding LacI/PurR family transcriptional regulator
MFLRRGHSRIALLVARDPSDNSKPIETGFLRGFADFAPRPGERPLVLHHDGTVQGIRDLLASLFRSKTPPTGLLVVRPQHLLTVISHLMQSGVRIPQDVSLVGMGHDPSLDHIVPSVAHYQIDWNEFDHRLRRQVLQLAKTGKVTKGAVSLMCEFRDGETLVARP